MNSSSKYPCPECDEEIRKGDMVMHRYEEHDLLLSEQLENIPEGYGESDEQDENPDKPNKSDLPKAAKVKTRDKDNKLPRRLSMTEYGIENLEEGDELVRRSDVLDLIDQQIEEIEDVREKGFSVSPVAILKELRKEVEQE